MGQTRPLLVLFSFFSHNKYSTNTINDKSVDGVHGRRRRFHWAVMAVMAVMYLIIYCTYVSKQAASHRPFQFLLIGKTKWGGTIILLLWWFQEMQNHSFFPRFGQKICFLQFSTIFSPSRHCGNQAAAKSFGSKQKLSICVRYFIDGQCYKIATWQFMTEGRFWYRILAFKISTRAVKYIHWMGQIDRGSESQRPEFPRNIICS